MWSLFITFFDSSRYSLRNWSIIIELFSCYLTISVMHKTGETFGATIILPSKPMLTRYCSALQIWGTSTIYWFLTATMDFFYWLKSPFGPTLLSLLGDNRAPLLPLSTFFCEDSNTPLYLNTMFSSQFPQPNHT